MFQTKHFYLWLLVSILTLVIGCSVRPSHYHYSNVIQEDQFKTGPNTAFISQISFEHENVILTNDLKDEIKTSLIQSLKNSGHYKDVYYSNPNIESFEEWNFSLIIAPQIEYEWYAYFGIYPAPGYWPFQTYNANPKITLIATRKGSHLTEKTLTFQHSAQVYQEFYGFFIKDLINESIGSSLENVIRQFDEAVNLHSNSNEDQRFIAANKQVKADSPKDSSITTTPLIKSTTPTYLALQGFEAKGTSQSDADLVAEYFMTQLSYQKNFIFMERNKIDFVLNEQGFQKSGACNESQCQVEMGKLLGVDYITTGSLGKLGSMYLLNIKIISVETGEIVFNSSESVQGDIGQILGQPIQNILLQVPNL